MCGLSSTLIDYVVDTTPDKHWRYVPKSNISIQPYEKDSLDSVDYCFLGAWNYKDEIFKKESKFIANGGKFITHVPDVRTI